MRNSESERAHGSELFRFYDLAVEKKSGASLATFCSVFAAVRSRFQKLCLERKQ